MNNKNCIFFSDRLKIAKKFNEWADEHKARKDEFTLITYLFSRGLLDVEKTRAFLDADK